MIEFLMNRKPARTADLLLGESRLSMAKAAFWYLSLLCKTVIFKF